MIRTEDDYVIAATATINRTSITTTMTVPTAACALKPFSIVFFEIDALSAV